ncbi:uncharacterized protein HME9302_01116 [Alteripontixanthobacter maritimus]|uniref:DUF817 domain-containing protein n=1 Tax=Alteripontixanthobacter maritimus TaxID=2161824 RepID=A0A369QAH1_9SPHN|nr:DUF817 domain-containing protein [Alteripontixanthobacter maritimus]RDC59919.1 uncharacterized protein HME9302_01116 [Alteripontixanthobacter maritimus]
MTGARRHSRFHAIRLALEARVPRSGWRKGVYEFLLFGFKQAWACLFGGLLLALLLATHLFYPDDAALHRYDFLTLAAIAIQVTLVLFRLETVREAAVILVFHVVGTVMELFKTAVGSWTYPEESLLHIGAVPLFSGFMYAAVGSYIARIWRIFEFRFSAYPPLWATWLLAVAIYVNFFAHHYVADMRWVLFVLTALVWWQCRVHFKPWQTYRAMPMLVGFGLVALFIWFAENIATFANAWRYPDQERDWQLVGLAKLGSWYLLMLISFVLVASIQKPKAFVAKLNREGAA